MLSSVLVLALAAAPLVDAIKSGDKAAALALIDQRADVNASEPDGTTALHWAVHQNDLDLVERLLHAGAKANAVNAYGASPMSEAATTGNPQLLDALLKAGADVESSNPDGQTALMIVSRTGRVEAAQVLLRHGAKVNTVEKWHGQTALMWAAAQGQPEMVKTLVAAGADVNARSIVNNWQRQVTAEPRAIYRPAGGLTPLLYVAREGCVDCAKYLVEGGADLDEADPEEVSPLLLSILNGHFDLAAYLIQKGANPGKFDWYGRTPLYAAVDMNTLPRGGRPDRPSLDRTTGVQIIEQLLEAGAYPNPQMKLAPPFRNVGNDRGLDRTLTIGTTPLLRVAKALDAPAIRLLLQHGASINLSTIQGVTPVMAAAGLGSVDADTRGIFTTEDVQQRSIDSLKLLIAAGANINSKESGRGLTPLHEAARWGWNDVVKYLVEQGADLSAKDNRGMTPLDSALGKAGGNSRGGARIDVHEDTAALLRTLVAANTTTAPAGHP
jgi:ankyrin repeat protein